MKFVTDIIQMVTAFISSGVPPNTPPSDMERLQSVNHMESKKFFAFFVSVGVMIFFYFATLGILFFIPHVPELITGCITVYTKTAEILAIVIGSYIGAQAVVDLKYNSSSNSSLESNTQTINEHIIEEITVIETNQKEDDYELT